MGFKKAKKKERLFIFHLLMCQGFCVEKRKSKSWLLMEAGKQLKILKRRFVWGTYFRSRWSNEYAKVL
jgi:hypothetical protein